MKTKTTTTFSTDERCPWYESIYRIILILFGTITVYCICVAGIFAALMFLTKLSGRPILEWVVTTLIKHPTLTIVLLITGFIATLFCYLKQLIKAFYDE